MSGVVVLGGVSGAPRGAAAAEDQVPEFRLGEVVVTGKEERVVEQATTVSEVTAEEIRAKGARTLNEALDLLPGLFIRVGGDGTPRMDVRGMRTRNVMLLVDGVPVNSTFDNQWDPTLVPVENIARIKVSRGPNSILYGDGGNGGVINIITKKGEKTPHGSLSAEYGQGPTRLVRGSAGAGTDDVDAFVSGSVYDQNGFPLSDGFTPTAAENGGTRINSDRERRNAYGNLVYRPDDMTEIGLSASYTRGKHGLPPVTNFSASDPFTKSAKFDRVEPDVGYSAQVGITHDFEMPLQLRSWIYMNELAEVTNRYDDVTFSSQVKNNAFHAHSLAQNYGGAVQLAYDMGAWGHATLAFNGRQEHFDSQNDKVQIKAGKKKTIVTIENSNFEAFSTGLEYEVRPMDGLGVVLGLGKEFQSRDGGTSDEDMTYIVGATYDATDTTRLHASHAKKIRFPSLKELFDGDAANPNLVTERTFHYEVGVEQTVPDWDTTFGATPFIVFAENFIEKNSAGVYSNFQNYRFRGVEVTAVNRSIKHLLLSFGYTYLDSVDLSSGRHHDDLQFRPRHKGSVEARYDFGWGLSAYLSYLLVAEQKFYTDDDLQQKKAPDYNLVAIKVMQEIVPGRLDAYVRVDNLFDVNYEQAYGLPQAGRIVYVGADAKF
ncbi:MAG: TonB-dependent receptor [Alphaproteobacteria bacterium]